MAGLQIQPKTREILYSLPHLQHHPKSPSKPKPVLIQTTTYHQSPWPSLHGFTARKPSITTIPHHRHDITSAIGNTQITTSIITMAAQSTPVLLTATIKSITTTADPPCSLPQSPSPLLPSHTAIAAVDPATPTSCPSLRGLSNQKKENCSSTRREMKK
jgi:hypothetical protein